MLDFIIIVNDAGELKTITAYQLQEWLEGVSPVDPDSFREKLDKVFNFILDARSQAEEDEPDK